MIRLFSIIFLCGIYGQMLGPADVKFTRIEKCGEDIEGVSINFYKHKINRTHDGTDFNFTLPFDLDKTVAINISIAKWGDGGWKPNFMNMDDDDLCRFMFKYGEKKMEELATALKIPCKCPVVAGTYSTTNFVYDGVVDYPVMYGDFRCDFKFIKNGIPYSCIRAFVTTKPKMKFGR